MADDPFTLFTRKPKPEAGRPPASAPKAPPPSAPNRPKAREAYEPFGAKDKVHCLDVRCARAGVDVAIPYHLLGAVFTKRSHDGLFFSGAGLAVTIRGRNLRPIADAIRLYTCDFIQEFTPDAFQQPQPADPAAPFIEAIDVEPMTGPPGDFL
jgi:hypothetical protein